MKLTYRPIPEGGWPGELRTDARRVRSPYSAGWRSTLDLLETQVDQLASKGRFRTNAVLQLAVPEHAIRQDGQIRSGAKRPEHPGVILSFEDRDGTPYQFYTDKYERGVDGWQHNVRAIAVGIEALRKIERTGLNTGTEQYRGFQALGSGIEMGPASAMTVDEAVRVMHDAAPGAHWEWDEPTQVKAAYRVASKGMHPDAGGDPAAFRRLTEARDVLIGRP